MSSAKLALSYDHSASCQRTWIADERKLRSGAGYCIIGTESKRRLATDGYTKFVFNRRKRMARWELVRQLVESSIATQPQSATQLRFDELAKRWREETRSVSSTTERAMNSAYQDIIGMGKPAIPLILHELATNGGHWFWALRHITHENPVSPQDAGNIPKIREAWLRWGREHHYL
jgi:hypothetical protein